MANGPTGYCGGYGGRPDIGSSLPEHGGGYGSKYGGGYHAGSGFLVQIERTYYNGSGQRFVKIPELEICCTTRIANSYVFGLVRIR
jgi:hypothetical protein